MHSLGEKIPIKYWDREKARKPFIYRIKSFQTFLNDKFTINFWWSNLCDTIEFRRATAHNNNEINFCSIHFFPLRNWHPFRVKLLELIVEFQKIATNRLWNVHCRERVSIFYLLSVILNGLEIYIDFRHWAVGLCVCVKLHGKKKMLHIILFKPFVYWKANRFHIRCILFVYFFFFFCSRIVFLANKEQHSNSDFAGPFPIFFFLGNFMFQNYFTSISYIVNSRKIDVNFIEVCAENERLQLWFKYEENQIGKCAHKQQQWINE